MNAAADLLSVVTAAAYAVLALMAIVDWGRHRDFRRGYIALALTCLAAVACGSQVARITRLSGEPAAIYADIAIAVFLASGFFVLLFRHSFIPLRGRWLVAASIATLAGVGVSIAAALPASSDVLTTPAQQAVSAVLVGLWSVMVAEPIVHFWRAATRLPRVQKQRMRALSLGFSTLIVLLVASVAMGSTGQHPEARLVLQVFALTTLPVFWVSLAPPKWLRQQWRAPEEDALRRAIGDLLIYSTGRSALAEQAVSWAPRLVGGQGALLMDSDGTILASVDIAAPVQAAIVEARARQPEDGVVKLRHGGTAIAVTLPLETGPGALAVLSGPFSPVFGAEDVLMLSAYASSVTAGLERARVSERVAAMERTKTQFLNLASHELRGPLTVIRGYVSMLEQGGFGEVNEAGRRALSIMGAKGAEMNALVEQMLEAARLEEGRIALRLEAHDLRELVRLSIELVEPMIDEQHPISVDVPDRPVRVEVDAERIQTIVANLLDNAVKYSPGGGEVAIEVARSRRGPSVRVRDRGLGIAAESLPTLFTRFGRVATPDTSHLPGTGLGLYLSRELARLHGGDITVESRPGLGSTFTLHLPALA